MERKRVAGRFVREGLDGDGGARQEESKGGGRGSEAEAMQDVYTGEGGGGAAGDRGTFVEEAKKGSIAHAKMLTTLGGLDKRRGAGGEEAAGEERGGVADREDDAGARRSKSVGGRAWIDIRTRRKVRMDGALRAFAAGLGWLRQKRGWSVDGFHK